MAETNAQKVARLEKELAALAGTPATAPVATGTATILGVPFTAAERDFSTKRADGSPKRGYFFGGKVTHGGKRYQVSCSAVELIDAK